MYTHAKGHIHKDPEVHVRNPACTKAAVKVSRVFRMFNLDTVKEEEGCLFWSGGQKDSLVDLRRGRYMPSFFPFFFFFFFFL